MQSGRSETAFHSFSHHPASCVVKIPQMLSIKLSSLLLHLVMNSLVPQTLAVPNTQHGAGFRSLQLEARMTSRPSEAVAWSNTGTLINIEDEYDLDVCE